jgi:hypothetical protein
MTRLYFFQEKWSVVLRDIDDLKSEVWEIVNVIPMGWEEVYEFKHTPA